MRIMIRMSAAAVLLILTLGVWAQTTTGPVNPTGRPGSDESPDGGETQAQTQSQPEEQQQAAFQALPTGFNRVQLGMDLNSVQQALEADGNFNYRGEPDVSMLRSRNDSLIQCDGFDFIQQASFQFVDDGLFTITLILNRNRIGYYTMYSTLQEKYGEPERLSPDKAVWENEQVQMALERPLRVKYIAMPVLEEMRRSSTREKSLERLNRERFLEQF